MNEAERLRHAEWAMHRVMTELGISLDDRGEYIPWRHRCAPRLGWPLANLPQESIEAGYVAVMLQAQAAQQIRRLNKIKVADDGLE